MQVTDKNFIKVNKLKEGKTTSQSQSFDQVSKLHETNFDWSTIFSEAGNVSEE